MRRKSFLEETAKGVGSGKQLIGGAQRKQSIGVDFFQAHGQLLRGAANHVRQEKTGEVVGDDDAGMAGERGEQALPCTDRALDVRIIVDSTLS